MGILFVLGGNVVRLGGGVLVLVLVARQLGPHDFGQFSYALALATLASMPVNFGMASHVLREFGARPEARHPLLCDALSAKLLMLGATLTVSLAAAALWLDPRLWLLAGALLLAQLAESFSEFYILAFRAAGRLQDEAASATVVTTVHLVLVGAAAGLLDGRPELVGLAFMASRLAGLAWMRRQAHLVHRPIAPAGRAAGLRALRQSLAYACEFGLTTLSSQVDVLIIERLLGAHALGLYQAGMKLVQGLARLAPILALYGLPMVTRQLGPAAVDDGRRRARVAWLTIAVFGLIGALLGGLLAALAEPIARIGFGGAYLELGALLPALGLLLALRFLETGSGVVLVASGLQGRKTWLVAGQLALLLGLGPAWVLRDGVAGWVTANITCTGLLVLTYLALRRWGRPGRAQAGVEAGDPGA